MIKYVFHFRNYGTKFKTSDPGSHSYDIIKLHLIRGKEREKRFNFTNILHEAYLYLSFVRSFFLCLHFRFELFLAQEYRRKCAHKNVGEIDHKKKSLEIDVLSMFSKCADKNVGEIDQRKKSLEIDVSSMFSKCAHKNVGEIDHGKKSLEIDVSSSVKIKLIRLSLKSSTLSFSSKCRNGIFES
jgi:hypothetical protein